MLLMLVEQTCGTSLEFNIVCIFKLQIYAFLNFFLGPFPCDICGRQFNDTGNLKRHIECTHGGKRKWTCFICGKSVRER